MHGPKGLLKALTAIMALLALQALAASADEIVELRPGLTWTLKPDRQVRSVSVGNPNLADVTMINSNAIAITGKGIGATNVVLFDSDGKEFASYVVQVVAGVHYKEGNDMERREITTVQLVTDKASGKSEWVTRSYLCGPSCSPMSDTPPLASNPPTGAPPSSTTTRTLNQNINQSLSGTGFAQPQAVVPTGGQAPPQ